MILTGLRLKKRFKKYKLDCGKSSQKLKKKLKTLKIALKLPKSPYFLEKIFLKSNIRP